MTESAGRTPSPSAAPEGVVRPPVLDIVLGASTWVAAAAFVTAVLLVLAGVPAPGPVAVLAVLVVVCAGIVAAGRTRTPRRTADGRDVPDPSTTDSAA